MTTSKRQPYDDFDPGFLTMFEACDIVLTRDVALFENDIGRRLPFGLF